MKRRKIDDIITGQSKDEKERGDQCDSHWRTQVADCSSPAPSSLIPDLICPQILFLTYFPLGALICPQILFFFTYFPL